MTPASTLACILQVGASRHRAREALVYLRDGEQVSTRWTFAELDAFARRFASALSRRFLPGERIVIACPDAPQFVAALFGCSYAGLIAVPAPPPAREFEAALLCRVAADAQAAAILTGPDGRNATAKCSEWTTLRATIIEVDDLLADGSIEFEICPAAPDAPALIQYTSGSTRQPRGVVLSHENIVANQRMIAEAFAHDDKSTFVTWLPLFHDMGLIGSVLQPLFVGAPCVVMPTQAFMAKPIRWLRAIANFGAHTSGSPSFGYHLCARRMPATGLDGLDLSSWRIAFNGAEPVRAEVMEEFGRRFRPHGFSPASFYPCYGLAECTLFVTGGTAGNGARVLSASRASLAAGQLCGATDGTISAVALGQGWHDTRIAIVDPRTGRPCANGTVGEIWVSGRAVARGYWNRPAETQAVFGARIDPDDGLPYLRTGDLGAWHEGDLYVTGRSKDLILSAGTNHYPQDIEWAAERSHPAVRAGCSAAVAVDTEVGVRVMLIAEVQRRLAPSSYPQVADAIARGVSVEAGIMLDEIVLVRAGVLPKTTSGKVRRSAACEGCVDAGVLYRRGAAVAVRETAGAHCAEGDSDELEEWLARRVAHMLQIPRSGLRDDRSLPALGLDSLAIMRLLHMIEEDVAAQVELAAAWSAPNLAAFADAIRAAPRIRPAPAPAPAEDLSCGEAALYFESESTAGAGHAMLARAFEVPAGIATHELAAAVDQLIRRHPSLRTRFPCRDGAPRRRVEPARDGRLSVVNSRDWDDDRLRQEIARLLTAPIDLATGPLFRPVLLDCLSRRILLVAAHHLVADHWSLALWLGELNMLCTGVPLPTMPDLDMAHIAAQERQRLAAPEYARLAQYWQTALAGDIAPVQWPEYSGAGIDTRACASTRVECPKPLLRALVDLAAVRGSSLAAVLLAGYYLLLQRYTGNDTNIVGVPAAARDQAGLADVVGYLVNLLPVRVRVPPGASFAALAAVVARELAGALGHGALPFPHIAALTAAPRIPGRRRLVQTSFVLLEEPLLPEWRPVVCEPAGVSLELEATFSRQGDDAALVLAYDTSLLEERTVAAMASDYIATLEAAVSEPDRPLDGLMTVQGATPDVHAGLLFRRFERQAALRPHAVALVLDEATLTYGELDARANALAWKLQDAGARPDQPVALIGERSVEAIVAMIGILKAGAAYLPLHPGVPDARLAEILAQTGTSIAVRTDTSPQRLPTGVRTLSVDAARSDAAPQAKARPDNLAYVIATSGSTGQPKTVGVCHSQVCALLDAAQPIFAFTADDVWTQFHSLAFDFSVWEVFGALTLGGILVLVPAQTARSPNSFAALLRRHAVTVLNQVPSAFAGLAGLDSLPAALDGHALRLIMFGGEPLDFPSLRAWTGTFGYDRPQLVNMYGITETTVNVTWHPLAADDVIRSRQLIGRPLPHLETHVLDSNLRPAPVGVRGEIFVGGAGLARAYMGAPDHTAERFFPNPFGAEPGSRLYRTGDLGRVLPQGGIEFLGRVDRQLQIGGHRIEPVEIERAFCQHPEVCRAAVFGLPVDGSLSLSAVVATRAEEPPAAEALRLHLAQMVPSYMLPARLVVTDALPHTPGGKLDYTALKAMVEAASATSSRTAGFRSPGTAGEKTIADAYASVLGLAAVGSDDDYFALGGDSLLALRVVARCRAAGLDVSVEKLFQTPRVCDLARASGSAEVPAAAPRPFQLFPPELKGRLQGHVVDAYPATALQRQLMARSRTGYGHECYISRYRVGMQFRRDVFERAVQRVAERHAMLRTTFDDLGSEHPWQLVHAHQAIPIAEEDLRGMNEEQQSERLRSSDYTARAAPIDWLGGPLVSLRVHRLTDHEIALTLIEPFLDGWSVMLVVRDLLEFYGAEIGLADPKARGVPAPFAAFVEQELQAHASEQFWRSRVAALPADSLPFVSASTSTRRDPVRREELLVPAEIGAELQRISRDERIPLKSLLLAAHLRAVSVQSGEGPTASAVMLNGRPELAGSDETVGLFLNALPIYCDPGADDWIAFARRCHAWEKEVMPHRRMPFEHLQQWRDTPLCEIAFNFTNFHELQSLAAHSPARLLAWTASDQTYFPLTVQSSVDPLGDRIALAIDYDPARVARTTVMSLVSLHLAALEQACAHPRKPVRATTLAASNNDGRLAISRLTSRGAGDLPAVSALFDQAATRCSARIAIYGRDFALTFGQLGEAATRWAVQLRTRGIQADSRVGIAIERSPELVIAYLAVLKAGGCIVPFDPRLPAGRLAQLIATTEPSTVLADELGQAAVKAAGAAMPVIPLRALSTDGGMPPPTDGGATIHPDQLAFLLCTSGSTGAPKAVMGTHRGLSNRILWMSEAFPWRVHDVTAVKTSVAFVDSICEMLGPLCGGSAVAMIPWETEGDAVRFTRALVEARATRITVVPTLLWALMQALPEAPAGLPDFWISSGEPLTRTMASRFRQWLPGATLLNLYGSTEITADSTWRNAAEPFASSSVPCGHPIAGTCVYVLDRDLNLLPKGTVGEVYVGGCGLARGYRNVPAATAAAFLPDIGGTERGARMYCTGDLGLVTESGELVLTGRADQQAKIRGQRVEPSEVAAVLLEHAAVTAAACRLWPGLNGPELAAYAVVHDNAAVGENELDAHLRARLAAAQVPRTVTLLPSLPHTPAGKIAIAELPPPAPRGHPTPVITSVTERRIAALWRDLLGVEGIGTQDSFLQLGGHSLLAMTLLARLGTEFGVEVTAAMLFEHPTLAALAGLVDRLQSAGHALPVRSEAIAGSGHALSILQKDLWSLHHAFPAKRAAYNIPASLLLRGTLDVDVLRDSFAALAERHPILATAVRDRQGTVYGAPTRVQMEIDPAPANILPRHKIRRMLAEEADRPFDLSTGPLIRIRLLRCAPTEHLLIATLHHLAADEWSLGLLAAEISELYGAGVERRAPDLPLPLPHAAFAAWQAEHLDTREWRQQLIYWQDRLRGSRPTRLPPDRLEHRPATASRGISIAVPAKLCSRLRTIAADRSATLYMVLVAALDILLHARTGANDVSLGADCAQRLPEHASIVGPLVNQIVLRQQIRPEVGFECLLGSVRVAVIEAIEDRDIPYSAVFKAIAAERSSREPLFSVKLVLQAAPAPQWSMPGLSVSPMIVFPRATPFDVLLNLHEGSGAITGVVSYEATLYRAASMRAFADDFVEMLRRIAEDPNVTVAALADVARERDARHRDAEAARIQARSRQMLRRAPAPIDPGS
ncbi:non-ribosomal peptide synthetase [Sinorhizobium meliloti]|uniref:non-ribosomal peptide synthetase n=1 Tax=Rhizobium meliloti TaxID=382 RepID=UPI000FD7C9BA|nr:non-ribosomal peptide synthetase [Sinorhizobium meliloti]RVK17005.1 amino acid adenylation domain-containing protein [Sinorhizobium meliloti]